MERLSLFHAIILGAIQGATEFLPISSSAHLVFAEKLLDVPLNGGPLLAFDICLHFGTLLALFYVFWRDLIDMFKTILPPLKIRGGGGCYENKHLLGMILIGTIPAVIFGLGFKDFFERLFDDAFATSWQLVLTGVILWGTRYVRHHTVQAGTLNSGKALLIGLAQAIAIIPGISRSGSTIAAGLFLKLDQQFAARFSFLLAIPALAGATILGIDELRFFSPENLLATSVGTVVSFIVGVACIKWLLSIMRRGSFAWFAVYCWIVGAIGMWYFW